MCSKYSGPTENKVHNTEFSTEKSWCKNTRIFKKLLLCLHENEDEESNYLQQIISRKVLLRETNNTFLTLKFSKS